MTYFAKPDLLDTKRAAKILDVTVSALEAWRLQGRGPVYRKIGRLVRYVESDLLAYLDSCCRQSTSASEPCAAPTVIRHVTQKPLPRVVSSTSLETVKAPMGGKGGKGNPSFA